jgi:hypothetical protein
MFRTKVFGDASIIYLGLSLRETQGSVAISTFFLNEIAQAVPSKAKESSAFLAMTYDQVTLRESLTIILRQAFLILPLSKE